MNSIDRLKLYLALSRTPHGILDMAAPAFGVLLYLGAFPSLGIIVIGMITAFAGYTAIYALNDLVDYRSDREKIKFDPGGSEKYLDSLMIRHPMAAGLLSYRQGVAWTLGWAAVALVGAYILNPVCMLIFLFGAALETIYCLLWRVSPWRAVISGFVKNMGAVAALFAVDPDPSIRFMLLLFSCLFLWEIGGQNIPNDWADIEKDRRFNAQTIPVRLGAEKSAVLALISLSVATLVAIFLFYTRFPAMEWTAFFSVLVMGVYFLIAPAMRLYRSMAREDAMMLFDRASYFPVILLGLSILFVI